MKIFYSPLAPLKTRITQRFGENKACVPINGGKVIACDGHNPPAGYRSVYGDKGHLGVDFALLMGRGQEVRCAQTGKVIHIDTNERTGLDVRIETKMKEGKFIHIYEHLLGYQHHVGDEVTVGQVIGWGDNTGWSSGDHLHFQLLKWINGKYVSVDPEDYTDFTTDAKDILWIINKLKYIKEMVAQLLDTYGDKLRK